MQTASFAELAADSHQKSENKGLEHGSNQFTPVNE
jgi:hypothetical protein